MTSLRVYAFQDAGFAPDGNTHVCIVERRALSGFMSRRELGDLFSGYAVYKRGLLTCFIGVWGRRNGKRLRRFLAERGASVEIVRDRPADVRCALFATRRKRERARTLPQVSNARVAASTSS